jgi:hypothetical protein
LKAEKGNSERQALREQAAVIAASIFHQKEGLGAAEDSEPASSSYNGDTSGSPSKWKTAARNEALRQ